MYSASKVVWLRTDAIERPELKAFLRFSSVHESFDPTLIWSYSNANEVTSNIIIYFIRVSE